jgi:hypothetical protein
MEFSIPMTEKPRHIVLLEELRSLGHLDKLDGRVAVVTCPFWPESMARGSVKVAYWDETFDIRTGEVVHGCDRLYEMYLAENPIVTDDGEITFLHEMAHIVLGHGGAMTTKEIMAKLRIQRRCVQRIGASLADRKIVTVIRSGSRPTRYIIGESNEHHQRRA